MKITDVRTTILTGADPHGIGGKARGWKVMLVRVDTDEGIYGVGEAPHLQVSLMGVRDAILAIREHIIGRDPLVVRPLVSEVLYGAMPPHWLPLSLGAVPYGSVVWGLSGVEMALYDLAGKALGQPISVLLGGRFRDRVAVYLDRSSPVELDDLGAWRDIGREARAQGFGQLKFDIDYAAMDQPHDVWARTLTLAQLDRITARLGAVRAEVGPDVELMVDCHMQYTSTSAIQLARALAPLKLKWLEDPTPITNAGAMARVRQASPIPICVGELCTAEQFRDLIEGGACDIVHPDVLFAGGLGETRKIADLADLHAMPLALHNNSSSVGVVASAHVAAASRNFIGLEYHFYDAPWIGSLLDRGRPLFEDGHIVLDDTPGLGGVLDEDVCRRHLAPGESFF